MDEKPSSSDNALSSALSSTNSSDFAVEAEGAGLVGFLQECQSLCHLLNSEKGGEDVSSIILTGAWELCPFWPWPGAEVRMPRECWQGCHHCQSRSSSRLSQAGWLHPCSTSIVSSHAHPSIWDPWLLGSAWIGSLELAALSSKGRHETLV